MAEVTLEFLGRQMQRVLNNIGILQGGLDIVRRDVARMGDDIGIIKTDLQGVRGDLQGARAAFASVRNEMRAGFETLDARLRPLESAED